MIPITPKLWGYVGICAGVLVLVAAVLWQANSLMKKGIELGKAKSTIETLEGEVKEATAWKDDALLTMAARDLSIETWQRTASAFEISYNEALLRQPEIIYRDIAARVPEVIPMGNCDVAAVASWHLLREAGLVGGVPP